MSRRWWLLIGLILMVVGAAVAFQDARVTEREEVYRPTFARQIELLEGWRVTLGSETARVIDGDSVPVVFLLLAAGFALAIGVLLRGVGEQVGRTAEFYLLGGTGLVLLALDELFGVHETLGHNLPFLTGLGVRNPDDVVFLVFPVAIGWFVWHFRDLLLERRQQRVGFAAAGFLLLVAAFSDLVLHPPELVEDAVELLAVTIGLVTLGGLVRRDLRRLSRAVQRALVSAR